MGWHTIPFAQEEKKLLTRLKAAGYTPDVVYDVGASNGSWSSQMAQVVPDAAYHLFEPLVDHNRSYADRMNETLAAQRKFSLHRIAVGDADGNIELGVTGDGYSSSVHYIENIGMTRATVPIRRIDRYAEANGLPRPNLIKIDVQGSEDAVLRGCGDLLKTVDVVLLEAWMIRGYGPRTPLLTELVQLLRPFGLVLVRLGDEYHNDSGELVHVDATFFSNALNQRLGAAWHTGWSQAA